MATFTNQATLTYNGGTVNSNIVTGELVQVLTASKTAAAESYRTGDLVTYVVQLRSTGAAALTGLRRTEFSEQNLRRAGVRNRVVDENHTDIGVLQNFCAPRRAMRRDIPNRNRKEFAKRTAQLKEELRINRRFRTGTLSKERQALLFTVGEHRAGNEAIVERMPAKPLSALRPRSSARSPLRRSKSTRSVGYLAASAIQRPKSAATVLVPAPPAAPVTAMVCPTRTLEASGMPSQRSLSARFRSSTTKASATGETR
jgi:hypothetical protein